MARTVLVVDDDRTLVEMLTFMLKRFGFETRAAYSGLQGLEILHAERIDLVVLDVMLPDVDGFEICRRIRSIPRIGEIPILMLSARSQVADRVAGFDAGADDYIAKPVVIKEIIDRIRTHLSRSQRLHDDAVPVIALVGAKGGVGVTTTVTNMALSLVAAQRRVILLDLGGPGLTATWMLGLEPGQTLLGFSSAEGPRLTMSGLQACILTHPSGLYYLPGHPREISVVTYRAGTLAEAVNLLQLHYDAVFIDLNVSTLAAHAEVMAHTTAILPVSERDSSCIWHLHMLWRWLEQNKLHPKVPGLVLVDRFPASTAEPPCELASQLGLELLAVIPPAAEALCDANRRREPLYLLDPHGAASQAYADLGRRVTKPPVELLAPNQPS